MRAKIVQSFICLLLASLGATPVYACHETTCKKQKFEVVVHTNYQKQPDLSQYGIKYMRFTGSFWQKGDDRFLLPQKSHVISLVSKKHGDHAGLMAIDIEKWGSLAAGSDAQVASHIQKRITIMDWVKEAAPKATVGYYSVIPVQGGYWAKSPADYEKWRKNNDRVQAFTDRLPVLFPSFYAERSDQARWAKYATDLLKESRRIAKGKPVYLVINPRYHTQACCGLAQKYVPKDFFAFQLKTIKDLGYNGVVIWQWASGTSPWSENLSWWQATKKFLGAN